MARYSQEDEQISDGVNLLVSLLVRYPEIGTISFAPENNSLKMTFLLSGKLSSSEFVLMKKLLLDSIAAYHDLEGIETFMTDVTYYTYDQVTMVTIYRDVATITKGEIALIITLLRDKLAERLVIDHNEGMLEEDLMAQEELIESMLESMRKQQSAHGLIGIREDGRVLVFNK